MIILPEFESDLLKLKSFANKLAVNIQLGDKYLLSGDLGVGKTTFSRFFINALYFRSKTNKPLNIKSPSYPILINYPLLGYEIYHYDLYRLKSKNELDELGFLENSRKNITIIEWPEIILNNFNLSNYHLINFKFINENKRNITHQYFESNDC